MKCDQADSVRYIEPTRGQAAFAVSSVLPLRHSQNCPFLLPPPQHSVLKKTRPEGKVLRGSHQESPISASEDSSARDKKPK